MKYAKVVKGQVVKYPYSFADLRTDNPNVSFPREPTAAMFEEFGVVEVREKAPEDYDPVTHIAREGTPQFVELDRAWEQTFTLEERSAEDVAARRAELVDTEAKTTVKADSFVTAFLNMTPAEVSAYITANSTTLAALRTIVIKLAQIVLILAKRELK